MVFVHTGQQGASPMSTSVLKNIVKLADGIYMTLDQIDQWCSTSGLPSKNERWLAWRLVVKQALKGARKCNTTLDPAEDFNFKEEL